MARMAGRVYRTIVLGPAYDWHGTQSTLNALVVIMAFRIPDHLVAETMYVTTKRGAGKKAREPLLAVKDDWRGGNRQRDVETDSA